MASTSFHHHTRVRGNVSNFCCSCIRMMMPEEKGENCPDFVLSITWAVRTLGLHWLDGQQTAEFEVLNHRELLQTLDVHKSRENTQVDLVRREWSIKIGPVSTPPSTLMEQRGEAVHSNITAAVSWTEGAGGSFCFKTRKITGKKCKCLHTARPL